MASIQQRINKNGTKVWRAVIRLKGYPTVCDHFDRKREAEDWANETERKIRLGKYNFNRDAEQKTLADLIDRYIEDGVVDHHKASDDTLRHLAYFKKAIGSYALVFVTPELLLKERKKLVDSPTYRGTPRSPATVNRYMSSLGGAMNYAHRNLQWLDESPCSKLIKLKENPKQRRILTDDEEVRLLAACKESSATYLYCLVLLAITTGMRQGEILSLEWTDIDFDNYLAIIRTSKNGRPRKVSLVASVITELTHMHEAHNPHKSLVFASKTAFGRLDPKKAFQGALKRAKIVDFQFHGLRHHYCTTGGQLRAQLGHSTSIMTDHYSHLDAEDTRYIGEAIEKRLKKELCTK